MYLLSYDPAKKKTIKCGTIAGCVLFRDVKPEHLMRVLQGYGIQEVAFKRAVAKGIKKIVLKETHTNHRWEADIETWSNHGFVANYGNGKQRFLSMKYMKTHKLEV